MTILQWESLRQRDIHFLGSFFSCSISVSTSVAGDYSSVASTERFPSSNKNTCHTDSEMLPFYPLKNLGNIYIKSLTIIIPHTFSTDSMNFPSMKIQNVL